MSFIYKSLLLFIFINAFFNFQAKIYGQYSISGHISFSDDNSPVSTGNIYILSYDASQGIITYYDSCSVNLNGNYSLSTSHNDSVLIFTGWLSQEGDVDHVNTYYKSTIDWTKAKPIYPPDNPTNIDIAVQRIVPADDLSSFSGTITTLDVNNNSIPVVGATVVAQQDTIFTAATITDNNGNFTLDSLRNGTATILATKIGYALDSSTINVGGNNLNQTNLHLKSILKSNLTHKIINQFHLSQNYPNPFNPVTTIKFDIPNWVINEIPVKLTIYDILGQEVTILINENLKAGQYEIKWDASKYSSGIYFYELRCRTFKDIKRMILVK